MAAVNCITQAVALGYLFTSKYGGGGETAAATEWDLVSKTQNGDKERQNSTIMVDTKVKIAY